MKNDLRPGQASVRRGGVQTCRPHGGDAEEGVRSVGFVREEQIVPVVRGGDPGLSGATSETGRRGLFSPKQVYAGISVTFHQARFLNRNGTLCLLCCQGIQNKDSS